MISGNINYSLILVLKSNEYDPDDTDTLLAAFR